LPENFIISRNIFDPLKDSFPCPVQPTTDHRTALLAWKPKRPLVETANNKKTEKLLCEMLLKFQPLLSERCSRERLLGF
jgi:hypothetical protein